jgi:uncharacterized membrane protein
VIRIISIITFNIFNLGGVNKMSIYNHGFFSNILTLPLWILLSIGAIVLIVFLILLIEILEGNIKITGYDGDDDKKDEWLGTNDPFWQSSGYPHTDNENSNDHQILY